MRLVPALRLVHVQLQQRSDPRPCWVSNTGTAPDRGACSCSNHALAQVITRFCVIKKLQDGLGKRLGACRASNVAGLGTNKRAAAGFTRAIRTHTAFSSQWVPSRRGNPPVSFARKCNASSNAVERTPVRIARSRPSRGHKTDINLNTWVYELQRLFGAPDTMSLSLIHI